jgi:hypothetical protein
MSSATDLYRVSACVFGLQIESLHPLSSLSLTMGEGAHPNARGRGRRRRAPARQPCSASSFLRELEFETTRNNSEKLGKTRNNSKQLETTRNNSKQLETTRKNSEKLETIRNNSKQLETTRNNSKQLETTRNNSEKLGKTRNAPRHHLGAQLRGGVRGLRVLLLRLRHAAPTRRRATQKLRIV